MPAAKANLAVDISATVAGNRAVSRQTWRIRLRLPAAAGPGFENIVPGQFVLLDLRGAGLPDAAGDRSDLPYRPHRHILLRRPFSPMEVRADPGGVELDILYRVVGPGTIRMTALAPGRQLMVFGPLGRGFNIGPDKGSLLLVAGGSGLPPIYHLAAWIKRHRPQIRAEVLLGARGVASLPLAPDQGGTISQLQDLGHALYLTTDDGSLGQKGAVTDCLEARLQAYPQTDLRRLLVCACGPEPMLAQVARLAAEYDVDCQIGMERYMACGTGLCQGCAVPCRTDKGQTYRLCCADGPVFDAKQVVFAGSGP